MKCVWNALLTKIWGCSYFCMRFKAVFLLLFEEANAALFHCFRALWYSKITALLVEQYFMMRPLFFARLKSDSRKQRTRFFYWFTFLSKLWSLWIQKDFLLTFLMLPFDEELIWESVFTIFEEQTIHLEEKERKKAENRLSNDYNLTSLLKIWSSIWNSFSFVCYRVEISMSSLK